MKFSVLRKIAITWCVTHAESYSVEDKMRRKLMWTYSYMGSNTRVRPRRTARDLLSTGDAKSLVDRATCLKNPAWQAVEA